nr:MAG TPA: hypothetical protein [Caudoviricetes sp.]
MIWLCEGKANVNYRVSIQMLSLVFYYYQDSI